MKSAGERLVSLDFKIIAALTDISKVNNIHTIKKMIDGGVNVGLRTVSYPGIPKYVTIPLNDSNTNVISKDII